MLLVTLWTNIQALNVQGVFHNGDYSPFGVIYRYNLNGLKIITDNEVITAVEGAHLPNHNNDHVIGLGINTQVVSFFPKGFNNHFRYLQGIECANTGLKVIRKSDLSPFPKLKVIWMQGNRIESLDEDVFEGNPELQIIYLVNNDIKYVAGDILRPLLSLTAAYLSSNRCVNLDARDSSQIVSLKAALKTNCPSLKQQISVLEQENNELTSNAKESKENIKKLEDELKKVKSDLMIFWETEIVDCVKSVKRIGKCMQDMTGICQ